MYHTTTTQEPEPMPPPTERRATREREPLSQPAGYVGRKARRAHAKRLSRTKRGGQ
jgi:hypothetical protein